MNADFTERLYWHPPFWALLWSQGACCAQAWRSGLCGHILTACYSSGAVMVIALLVIQKGPPVNCQPVTAWVQPPSFELDKVLSASMHY